jgi:hypothetical protein
MNAREKTSLVLLSRDGRRILLGTSGTTYQLWDVEEGTSIGRAINYSGRSLWTALSADGSTFLAIDATGEARLWDSQTGRLIAPALQCQGSFRSAAFSADGRSVAIACQAPIDGETFDPNTFYPTRLWHLPPPLEEDADHLILDTQILTGRELNNVNQVLWLDAERWNQLRSRLHTLETSARSEEEHQ